MKLSNSERICIKAVEHPQKIMRLEICALSLMFFACKLFFEGVQHFIMIFYYIHYFRHFWEQLR